MNNPWLAVPLNDYEGHMNSEPVQQLGTLRELFRELLAETRPGSVAILGVAGGNGLEEIDRAMTRRVCAIDVNAEYLQAAGQRFADLPGLELCCVNLAEQDSEAGPVELVHAALIFEHAGTERCLKNAVKLVAEGGHLSVVLQLASRTQEENIGSQAPASIQELRRIFRLVEPGELQRQLEREGLRLQRESERPLTSGKAFWMGLFKKAKNFRD